MSMPPPPAGPAGRPLGFGGAVSWMLLALATLLFSAQLLASIKPAIVDDLVSLGIVDAAVYVLFTALLVGLHGPVLPEAAASVEGAPRPAEATSNSALYAAIGARRTHLLTIPLGLALGVVSQIPADSLRVLVERFSPSPKEELLERAAMLHAESIPHAVMLVFVAGCLVPLAEEMFFRGALYGALRRSGHSAVGVAVVTSIGFAVSHLDPRLWLPIVFMAALLGFMRVMTGSILPCVAMHVGFNSLTVVASVTGLLPAEGDVQVPIRGQIAGWLLTLVLLFTVWMLARKSEHIARSRRDDADGR